MNSLCESGVSVTKSRQHVTLLLVLVTSITSTTLCTFRACFIVHDDFRHTFPTGDPAHASYRPTQQQLSLFVSALSSTTMLGTLSVSWSGFSDPSGLANLALGIANSSSGCAVTVCSTFCCCAERPSWIIAAYPNLYFRIAPLA